jgi:uncharacterized repeat protein (TIGR01451 family)
MTLSSALFAQFGNFPSVSSVRRNFWITFVATLLATIGSQFTLAQIKVTTTTPGVLNDTSNCSLQEAMYASAFGASKAVSQYFGGKDITYQTGCTAPQGDWGTIVLDNQTYTFSTYWDGDTHNPFGPTTTPIVFTSMTIEGHGATLLWSGGTVHSRLFAVGYANLNTLDDGTSYSGTGNLTLQDLHIKGFSVKGGNGTDGGGGGLGAGGAIYLYNGVLTIQNSTFDGNSATGGNGEEGGGISGGGGGLGGNGGHTGEDLDVQFAGGGGGGARGDGGAGDLGGGGGGGTVFPGGNDSSSSGNVGGAGGVYCGGYGGAYSDNGTSGQNGQCPGGGGGGGGDAGQTTLGLQNGGNGSYGGGGGGGPSNGGKGGFGGGGGAGAQGGPFGGGFGGNGGFGAGGGGGDTAFGGPGSGGLFGGNALTSFGIGAFGGGGAALGGAIFNDSGTLAIENCTFANNFVNRGTGGVDSNGTIQGDNGAGVGGAIFAHNGSTTIIDSTIANNQSTNLGGGVVVFGEGSAATSLTLADTIIANNGTTECYVSGLFTPTGAGNLIMSNGTNSGGFGACPGVVVTSDPQLGTLQPNAPGDTPTMAIQYGTSPAVDAADDDVALPTDQRGVSRPQGPHTDIGAYEAPAPTADLSIAKTRSSATAQPGDTVTYTLAVNNAGPNTANSVTVTDTLPSQLAFVSCTADAGGVCTFSGGVVMVAYPSLTASASSTVTIMTTLNSGVTDGQTVGNMASVGATSPTDPNPNNNASTAYFTIHNRADLAVTKTVTTTSPYSPQVEVGDSLTYTVTLTNKGPYDARVVVLSDSAPAGVTYTGCSASVGTCIWAPSGASLSLAALTNGSVATLTIQATLNFGVADGSTVTNTASVTSTTFDPDLSNNAASINFTALNNSDLAVSQSSTKLTNRQLKYTISVKNLGKYLAKKLVLSDAIPSGSYFVSITQGAWTCNAPAVGASGAISCSLNTGAVGVTQSLVFVVKIITPASVLVNNTASVSEATFDPNMANNMSTVSTKVGP